MKYAHRESSSPRINPENRRGLDPAMLNAIPALRDAGRSFAYGFLFSNEYLVSKTRDELQALGVEIRGAHGDLYKARFSLEVDALDEVLQLPYVQWVGFNTPEQKIDARLQQARPRKSNDSKAGQHVIINLFDHDNGGHFGVALKAAGARISKYYPRPQAYRATILPGTIEQISSLDFVLFVEPVPVHRPGHDESMPTIGLDYIRPGGTGTRFGGSGAVLGIMDTGFMLGSGAAIQHVDLSSKFGCGKNFTTDGVDVWNDVDGHGTHVLGTIAGEGSGDSRYLGAAPESGAATDNRIRAAKVFNSTTAESEGTSLTDAMDWLGEDTDACGGPKPDVINFSGGAEGVNLVGTDIDARTLDDKVFVEKQLYVVAAGNEGPDAGTIGSPGVAKNALTVGNVLDWGYSTVGDISSDSSIGPTGDDRMKPNVVAPGEWISSVNAGTESGYIEFTGTSMAAPHVAGLALTLLDHYPATFADRPYLLRSHLMATAIPHESDPVPVNNNSGGRGTYGMGRVSTYLSHWSIDDANGWETSWHWGDVTNTNYLQFDVDVPTDTQRLVIVMTWDEPAASAGAPYAVVNDLDLWVDHGADCTESTGACGEYASQSSSDNVEYLLIDTPASGTYRIKASPWIAPASGVPTGITAFIIRGDLTPDLGLTASPSSQNTIIGSTFSVTTTASNPSYVASGVYLRAFLQTISTNVGIFGIGTANFGPEAVENFPLGNIVPTGDIGCSTDVIPAAPVSTEPQIALIERGDCFFSEKAFNAQQQGYDAYIVFNDAARADQVINMSASTNDPVTIPGIFVAHSAGLALQAVGTLLSDISEVTLSDVSTVHKDGIATSFPIDNMTLGNIIQSDSRSAIWTLQATSGGVKAVVFRVWSENGGTVNQTVTISAALDTDKDGIGDDIDTDDDNDGIPDTEDSFPLDTDNDGTDNDVDPDDDNDGMSDVDELTIGRNPLMNEAAILQVILSIEED